MRKIFTIAAREYNAVVRSKAFVISLVLLPLMMGAPSVMQRITKDVVDTRERTFAVIDQTPNQQIYAAIDDAVKKHNASVNDPATGRQLRPKFQLEKIEPAPLGDAALKQRYDLAERVRAGKLFGFISIGPDILKAVPATAPSFQQQDLPAPRVVSYYTNTPTFLDFRALVRQTVNDAVRKQRLEAVGVHSADFDSLLADVPVQDRGLPTKSPTGAITETRAMGEMLSVMIPMGLVILMLMVILIGAIPLTQGIIEEKQQRIAEVLLGSVSPFQLMMGKELGLVATSATLILIYLGGAYWAATKMGIAQHLSTGVLIWFILFQLLAVLMYGSLYIAIGASVTDAKEMQSLLMPVNLVMVVPLMMLVNVIQNPNGPLARIVTLFPPATPMIAMARIAVSPGMPFWEAIVAMLIVLATTTFFIWASGRIFRVGILMQGKAPSMGQLAKWVLRG
jgi:ABC-2 type transport system permease protein